MMYLYIILFFTSKNLIIEINIKHINKMYKSSSILDLISNIIPKIENYIFEDISLNNLQHIISFNYDSDYRDIYITFLNEKNYIIFCFKELVDFSTLKITYKYKDNIINEKELFNELSIFLFNSIE